MGSSVRIVESEWVFFLIWGQNSMWEDHRSTRELFRLFASLQALWHIRTVFDYHPGGTGIMPAPKPCPFKLTPNRNWWSQSHESNSFILSLKELLLISNHEPGSGPGCRKCEQGCFNVTSSSWALKSDCWLQSWLSHNSYVTSLKLFNLSVPWWHLW